MHRHRVGTSTSTEEDASTQTLGTDFNTARPLWNAEAYILLQKHLDKMKGEERIDEQLDESADRRLKMINDSLSYVHAFNNYSSIVSIDGARKLREQEQYRKISEWEVAVINNNRIDDYEEAITLCPTLRAKVENKEISQETIEQFLVELKRLQTL